MKSNQCIMRHSRTLLFSAAALVTTVASQAAAQGVDELGPYGVEPSRSQRTDEAFAFELRLGKYLPDVDSEFTNGRTPFADYYGSKKRWALGMEVDWLPLSIRDTLRFGPAFGIMYTTMSAHGKVHEPPPTVADQLTKLRVLPHWAAAVVRIDALNRRTFVPLVFAAKFGLAHALWWVSDEPNTRNARVDGEITNISGKGRSYGLYYGVGAYLDLGVFDSNRSKRLDAFTGINRMYLFGEIYGLELEGFGSQNVMHLSDRTWALGMAFDI